MSWPLVAIGEFCDLKNGFAFKSEDYINQSGTLICRMSNIRPGGYFDLEYSEKFLPDEYAEKYSEYLLKDGDVVIAMTDLASAPKILGVPTIVKTNGKNILLNQRVGKLVIKDESKIYFPYLQQALNYPKVREIYKKFSGGGLQINAGKKDILSVKVPLPPISEQKRIAAILDKADSLRRKNQQATQLADQFLRAVFLDMFGDPVSNPKGWEIEKFGNVGTLDRGKSKHRPRNDPILLSGKHPLIQTGDVANSRGYIKTFVSTYSDVGLQQSKKWPVGTLCITIAANIAKTGILTFEACFPDSVVGFIPKEKVTTEYIQHWLKFLQRTLEASAPESAQKNINLEILRNLSLPLPDKELQENFSKIVNQVLNIENNLDNSLSEDLFRSLSQQAFLGEQ